MAYRQRRVKGNRLRLNERMRYEHVYLSPAEREGFGETSKSPISINTAAVKHIILCKAFSRMGSFSEGNLAPSDEMMREVFRELSDTPSVSVPHGFLGTPISKFSLLPYLANMKYDVVGTIREECQQLLHNTMTEVRTSLVQTNNLIFFLM